MKVIRCPSCSARYNADRLPPGAVFECNRCGATVTVPTGAPTSMVLVFGGLFVLAALFVWSAETRTAAGILPWESFTAIGELEPKAGMVLWAVLGLWALTTALFRGFGGRSVLTLGLGALALVLAATASGAGFPLGSDRALPWMVGAIALAGGAVLVIRGNRSPLAPALLLGGGLTLLAWYALHFPGEASSGLERVIADVRGFFEGTLDEDASTVSHLAGSVGVHVAVLLAALGGIVAAAGLRAGGFGLFLVVLLAYAFLAPGAMRVGELLQGGFAWDRLAADGPRVLGRILVADGVALWALLAWATADLGGAREVTS